MNGEYPLHPPLALAGLFDCYTILKVIEISAVRWFDHLCLVLTIINAFAGLMGFVKG